MSEFLENLKKAADNGEFNSEAAKKINQINELAETKLTGNSENDIENLKEILKERIENSEIETVSEEKALELNSEYERKMEEIKKQDAINTQLATLIDIEDMVKLSVGDMFSFINELDNKFEKEFKEEIPMFGDLLVKIKEIKSKYNSIIN
jgi:hypothetical protein